MGQLLEIRHVSLPKSAKGNGSAVVSNWGICLFPIYLLPILDWLITTLPALMLLPLVLLHTDYSPDEIL
eukprot:scaffold143837_cov68-Cyclotella_meneghiniana.AAC.1